MARTWAPLAKKRGWEDEDWQDETQWKRRSAGQGYYEREGDGDRDWQQEEVEEEEEEEPAQPSRPSGRVPWRASSGRVPWRASGPAGAGEDGGEGQYDEGEGDGEAEGEGEQADEAGGGGEQADEAGGSGELADAAGGGGESDAEEQEMMRGLDELRQSLQEPEEGAEEPAAEEPVKAQQKIPAWRGRAEEAQQGSGGGKRRRLATPPTPPRKPRGRGPGGGYVVLTGVPLGYEHSTLVEMHQMFGLEAGALQSAEFEEPSEEDVPGTRRVVLAYGDEGSAQLAAAGLDGQLVQSHDGKVKALRAELQEARPAQASGHGRPPPPAQTALPSVRISGVPDSFTEEMVRELHEGTGVADADVVSVELLAASGETRACVARYRHDGAAQRAARELAGKQVLTSSGARKRLVTRREEAGPSGPSAPPPPPPPREAPRPPGLVGGPRRLTVAEALPPEPPHGGVRRHPTSFYEPPPRKKEIYSEPQWKQRRQEPSADEILPSVYISDVPVEISDEVLIDMHKGPTGEDPELVSVKHLPSKDPSGETRCCIARYRNQAAADRAIEALKGTQVMTASGRQKSLGARHAKLAQWMREKGKSSPPRAPAPPPPPGGGGFWSVRKREKMRLEDAALGSDPPLDTPLMATVKSWNDEKGFGFAAPDDFRVDIFVHRKVLHISRPWLTNGERVLLKVGWDSAKCKYHATACNGLGENNAEEDATAAAADPPPLDVLLLGTVKSFGDNGWGFIAPDGYQVDVFAHFSDLVHSTTQLRPAARVSFQVGWDDTKGKHRARFIELIADGGENGGDQVAGAFDSLAEGPGHPTGAAGRGATLLIGGLPSDVQEDLVESLVAAFCEVQRTRIALDPQGGSDELGPSKAALVDVASDEEARAAEEAVSEATWVGESLRVRVCRPSSNLPQNRLYVSGLPLAMKEDKVKELFSQHGNVSQVAILPTKGWGQSALVTVADVEEASLIVGLFDQHLVEGQQVPLTVRFAKPEGGLVPGRFRARDAADADARPAGGAAPQTMKGSMALARGL